jgi:hypothetical protein
MAHPPPPHRVLFILDAYSLLEPWQAAAVCRVAFRYLLTLHPDVRFNFRLFDSRPRAACDNSDLAHALKLRDSFSPLDQGSFARLVKAVDFCARWVQAQPPGEEEVGEARASTLKRAVLRSVREAFFAWNELQPSTDQVVLLSPCPPGNVRDVEAFLGPQVQLAQWARELTAPIHGRVVPMCWIDCRVLLLPEQDDGEPAQHLSDALAACKAKLVCLGALLLPECPPESHAEHGACVLVDGAASLVRIEALCTDLASPAFRQASLVLLHDTCARVQNPVDYGAFAGLLATNDSALQHVLQEWLDRRLVGRMSVVAGAAMAAVPDWVVIPFTKSSAVLCQGSTHMLPWIVAAAAPPVVLDGAAAAATTASLRPLATPEAQSPCVATPRDVRELFPAPVAAEAAPSPAVPAASIVSGPLNFLLSKLSSAESAMDITRQLVCAFPALGAKHWLRVREDAINVLKADKKNMRAQEVGVAVCIQLSKCDNDKSAKPLKGLLTAMAILYPTSTGRGEFSHVNDCILHLVKPMCEQLGKSRILQIVLQTWSLDAESPARVATGQPMAPPPLPRHSPRLAPKLAAVPAAVPAPAPRPRYPAEPMRAAAASDSPSKGTRMRPRKRAMFFNHFTQQAFSNPGAVRLIPPAAASVAEPLAPSCSNASSSSGRMVVLPSSSKVVMRTPSMPVPETPGDASPLARQPTRDCQKRLFDTL